MQLRQHLLKQIHQAQAAKYGHLVLLVQPQAAVLGWWWGADLLEIRYSVTRGSEHFLTGGRPVILLVSAR